MVASRKANLPEKFDNHEYHVLLVAEKYPTGFDQPLLHTMYVDKKLTGLNAVQILSRLNRTCAGKEVTFILDFRNKPEEIFKAFKPYYEDTPTEPLTDAQHLYRLQHQIEETGLIFEEEVKAFCAVYFKPHRKETFHDQAEMNGVLDQAVERFRNAPRMNACHSFPFTWMISRTMPTCAKSWERAGLKRGTVAACGSQGRARF